MQNTVVVSTVPVVAVTKTLKLSSHVLLSYRLKLFFAIGYIARLSIFFGNHFVETLYNFSG